MGQAEVVERGVDTPLPEKRAVFGVGVSACERYDVVVRCVVEAARARRPLMVSALSVHALMMAAEHDEMRRAIERAAIVTADGQPVRWALNRLHGLALRERVCGPELMPRLCDEAARAGLPIYLYGSVDAVLAPLRANLQRRFPALVVAGSFAPRMRPRRFPPLVDEAADREDAAQIAESGARLVFVGLGCPLQELWTAAQLDRLGMPALCVGAAFDFHAGRVRRAPKLMQDHGLEWLWRLGQNPRRLWRRYAETNTRFLLRLANDLARARYSSPPTISSSKNEG